tara:strand:- start:97 stop:303 length:207 start_codon:yes stop_codon:yes gene_type:complete
MADELLNELNASPDARVEAAWFIENVFEVAFGDGATTKDHSYQNVLDRLDEFSHRLPFHLVDEVGRDD